MEDPDGAGMRWGGRSAAAATIDLRSSWREASYLAIDVETTGLDLRRDSIVSVGSVGISGGRIVGGDTYYSLIRPACPVSVASMRIHCLRPADLENAPAAHDVGQQVAAKLAGRIVIAHAAWIEKAFLNRLLRQAGLRFTAPVIDTAALARALGYARDGSHGREPSLELLARQLALPVYAPHHALGDAITTAAVFLALATKAGTGGPEPASAQSLVKRSAEFSY